MNCAYPYVLFLITTKNINHLSLTMLNNSPPSRCVSSLHLRLIEKNWSSLYSCQVCDAHRGPSLHLALGAAARGKQTLELDLWLSEGVENMSGRAAKAVGSVTSWL